jgi:hypothetical protein
LFLNITDYVKMHEMYNFKIEVNIKLQRLGPPTGLFPQVF